MQASATVLAIREATTGAIVVELPRVWAVAEEVAAKPMKPLQEPTLEVAFYRKYTEAMLRRYVRLSMSGGRVPSLLGRELFRGNVTHYRVHGFDDMVIFCRDIESCLKGLGAVERDLIERIAMQEFTQGETAALTGRPLRSVVRKYAAALDSLTRRFLELHLLEPQKGCQAP